MDARFRCAGIVGVGLLGGSLGMALRRRGLAEEVVGICRRKSVAEEAVAAGAVDRAGPDFSLLSGADLVVFATPVLSIPALLREASPYLSAGCIVTDHGSTKRSLMEEMLPLTPDGAALVGGHPMAGSEQSGLAAAREDLFEDACYVLTPTVKSIGDSVTRLESMARALGARPLRMDAAEHDAAVARISHLPHVAAMAVAMAAIRGAPAPELLSELAAGGFRDTTRIALGDPTMWHDILLANRPEISLALDDLILQLGEFRSVLASGESADLHRVLIAAAAAREAVLPAGRK